MVFAVVVVMVAMSSMRVLLVRMVKAPTPIKAFVIPCTYVVTTNQSPICFARICMSPERGRHEDSATDQSAIAMDFTTI